MSTLSSGSHMTDDPTMATCGSGTKPPAPNVGTHFHRKLLMPNLSMRGMRTGGLAVILLIAALWPHVPSPLGAEPHMMQPLMQPRVPADKLAEARALTSPLPDSPEMIEKGKTLYNGKGTCFNCHGKDGGGNGPVAAQLDPSPRNFQHHGFWRHRTEGEIFWVIKHGSPGTSMIGFAGQLSDEDIWSLIQYERTFTVDHERGMMGHGKGRGPMMGPGGDSGGMEHRGPGGGMGGCEGEHDRCGQ